MSIKNVAVSAVLALMFLSLLTIYMATPPSRVITFLSVLIMLVGLIMAQTQSWRGIGILAAVAVTISLVAVGLAASMRFGLVGTLIAVLIWVSILSALFSWGRRNMIAVRKDRAILIRNMYSGLLQVAEGPIAPPLVPMVEVKVAIIPLYELSIEVQVEKVNTKRLNVDAIDVHVHYMVTNPRRALSGIPNRGQVQTEIAKELGKGLGEARLDVTFWEKFLHQQMKIEVDDIVRDVVYNNGFAQNPVEVYSKRGDLVDTVQERLQERVSRWGVEITGLEFERVDVHPDVYRRINKGFAREEMTIEGRMAAERDATRIELTGAAQAKAEAMRVAELVAALQSANVQLSADDLREIVIDAIHAATDMTLEGGFARALLEPRSADKK
jgi:regulator of protease activity HflC (stomatin/prohibitin superfamily)